MSARTTLPIFDVVAEIKEKLLTHQTVILQAPPGAGKSTVLPLELLHERWLAGKKIIMLQPRRLAARAVAQRLADTLQEETGRTAGYRIRFESRTGKETRIEVVTEGILTRMLQTNNSLDGVGLLIFDEFHERSLHADLALALALQIQQVLRHDLRILLMSATLDGEMLSSLLHNAPVISCSGRQHPVQLNYLPSATQSPLPMHAAHAIQKVFAKHPGDILVFLPGAGEIHRTHALLQATTLHALIVPLYGDLPPHKQQQALMPDPSGQRKIVLATSIAETSLTIEGITVVIDSGYSRVPRFDPGTGLTRLETIRVTKDSADQRAGRAGRLGPGTCYRLWSEGEHLHLVAHRTPEILEADLAPLVLELSQWGVKEMNELTWVTPPPAGAVKQAKEMLRALHATENNRITVKGKEMLHLPTHPRIAHMLLEARDMDRHTEKKFYTALAADTAALLEERDPLPVEKGADLTLRIEILRKWRAGGQVHADRNVLARIERLSLSWRTIFSASADNTYPAEQDAGQLLAQAYPERIARQIDKSAARYRLANGRIARLAAHDPLQKEQWLAVAHLDAGSKNSAGEGKIFLAAPIAPEALRHLTVQKEVVQWDASKGMITGTTENRIGSLALDTKPMEKIPEEQRIQILCDVIRQEGLQMLHVTDEWIRWQARVMSLRAWRQDEGWPDVSTQHLLDTLEEWLSPYLTLITKRTALEKIDVKECIAATIAWPLMQRIDTLAPDALKVPSGSLIRLDYSPDGSPPVMAVRLQEVFGMHETPTVNEGRTKILMHLLSPAYRPVQVTQDLRSFWERTYPEVRKELRVRYQKHHWPEDPWTAEAVRGVKRKQ